MPPVEVGGECVGTIGEPAERALRCVQPMNLAVGFNRRRHQPASPTGVTNRRHQPASPTGPHLRAGIPHSVFAFRVLSS